MKRTNEVSKLAGVSRRTLQYYDDEGILAVERTEKNHRLYNRETLERLWKIMLYKEIGFGLREIKLLLSVPDEKQKEYLLFHIKEIEKKIDKLEGQKELISLILAQGIPSMPQEKEEVTYKNKIEEIRKKISAK